MKNHVFVLLSIFAVLFCAALLCSGFGLNGYLQDCLFLNTAVMEEIGLNVPNTEFSALFLLYIQLVIYELTGIYNESPSYLRLCAHRLSRKKMILHRIKEKCRKTAFLFTAAAAIYILLAIRTTDDAVMIHVVIYLLRLHCLFLLFSVSYDVSVMIDLSEKWMTGFYILLVAAFVSDTFTKSGIITLSEDIPGECHLFLIEASVGIVIVYSLYMVLRTRKDLL